MFCIASRVAGGAVEEVNMKWLKRLFKRAPAQEVIVVSGLPRSGTSMMMRMLDMGGVDVLIDNIREPNQDNPKGYYEFERVKKMPEGDTDWLPDAVDKVVKVISALLVHLPEGYKYKVLFMNRHIEEILRSQRRMLVRRGEETDKVDDEEMAELFEKHLEKVYTWMNQQSNVTYLNVSYNAMLQDPRPFLRDIVAFLGRDLDVDAMAAVVDPSLYRQRHDVNNQAHDE